jgi:hypothetical protein
VEAVTLQIFVSLMLVVVSLVFFGLTQKQRDHEHADRLALLPLEDELPVSALPSSGDSGPNPDTHPKERSNGNRES